METFADRLNKAMKFRNFRQVDLVNKTKIDKGTISNYLSGKYAPKGTNAVLIAEALNVNLLWLLGHDVPMEIDQYVDYSNELPDGSYYRYEWEKDIDVNVTKEKWDSYYDKIMELPDGFRISVLKQVVLAAAMADMKKEMDKISGEDTPQ